MLEANLAMDAPYTFAQKIWGFSWKEHFPFGLTDTVKVVSAPFSIANTFVRENHQSLVLGNPYFLDGKSSPVSKTHFYENQVDSFLFIERDQIVGVLFAHPTDWSTYYIRFVALLPEFRGKGLYQEFLKKLKSVLVSYGVERLEIEVSPSNVKHISVLSRLDFYQVGLKTCERFGTLCLLRSYLSHKHKKIFQEQFCDYE